MGFNRKDLEGDDDNNEFNFEDTEGDGLNNFAFDDADLNMDEAGDQGFGFEGEDMPAMDDDAQQQRGVSRPFLIIAILMIVLFIGGLVALVVIATGNNSPSPIQLTSTAITQLNATTEALGFATATAAAEVAFAQTQTAAAPTPTQPPTDTPAPTETPTPAIQPTLDATQEAANALATQSARELEMTMQAATLTALAPTVTPGLSINDVQLTATALAILIGPGQGGGGGTPTQEGGLNITPFGPSPTPDALPQTGFFEDLAAGNANVAMMALIGIALVGVIFVSRYFRTVNK